MKITKEHYAHIEAEVNKVIAADPNMYAMYQAAGLTDQRYNWDLLYRAKLSTWLCDNVYKYANDDHVDTALKTITGKKG